MFWDNFFLRYRRKLLIIILGRVERSVSECVYWGREQLILLKGIENTGILRYLQVSKTLIIIKSVSQS